MSGTITVQNIQGPTTGSNANKVLVPSGHKLHAPGHIVQVSAFTQVNDLQIIINNSSSNTAITQVTSTITPERAGSKFLVNLHTQLYAPSGQYFAIMIFKSVNGGSYVGTTDKPHAYPGNVGAWQDCEISLIDTPTYTLGQSISYRPYVYTYNTSGNAYFGWGSSGGGSATTMFTMEIAQ